MQQSAHLTRPYSDEQQAKIAETKEGMANWAGGGPENTTCRECKFAFDFKRYAQSHKLKAGRLRAQRCQRFKLMMHKQGPAFDPNTRSCIFFDPASKPPVLVESEYRG